MPFSLQKWTQAFVCLSLVLVALNAGAQTADESLQPVIADFERLQRQYDPVSAGQEGDRAALRTLPDATPEAEQAQRKQLVALDERLAKIDANQLSGDAALNHRLLTRIVKESIEELGFDFERIPFENDSGFHTLPDYLGCTTTIGSREDADAWLARLEALPTFYQQNVANLKRGIKTRYTQPRIVVDRVLEVARKQVEGKPEDNSLLLPFARMPAGIPAAAQADYRSKALAIVRDKVYPAQRAFAEFLAREYVPAARPALAWRTTSGGEASYRFLVRRYTTTDMTPDQIHQLGEEEVARIRGLMDQAISQTGFKGSFAEFQKMLRTDPRFYARSATELLEKASEIAKRSDDQLPRLFGTLPRLTYEIGRAHV